jgi:hypothetical protein
VFRIDPKNIGELHFNANFSPIFGWLVSVGYTMESALENRGIHFLKMMRNKAFIKIGPAGAENCLLKSGMRLAYTDIDIFKFWRRLPA